MTAKVVAQELRKYGFAYDETVIYRDEWRGWSGVIDPLGMASTGGECRGIAVSGSTRAEMDNEAIREAKAAHPFLQHCTDPACEFHNPIEED